MKVLTKKEKMLFSLPLDTAEHLRVFAAKSRRHQSDVVDQAIRQLLSGSAVTSTLAPKQAVAS